MHPGDVLLKDFIEPLGISRYRVAKNINVPQRRIDLICRGEAAVSADMALRLGRLFGTTPEFWINLQAQYDLEVAECAAGKAMGRLLSRWRRDVPEERLVRSRSPRSLAEGLLV